MANADPRQRHGLLLHDGCPPPACAPGEGASWTIWTRSQGVGMWTYWNAHLKLSNWWRERDIRQGHELPSGTKQELKKLRPPGGRDRLCWIDVSLTRLLRTTRTTRCTRRTNLENWHGCRVIPPVVGDGHAEPHPPTRGRSTREQQRRRRDRESECTSLRVVTCTTLRVVRHSCVLLV